MRKLFKNAKECANTLSKKRIADEVSFMKEIIKKRKATKAIQVKGLKRSRRRLTSNLPYVDKAYWTESVKTWRQYKANSDKALHSYYRKLSMLSKALKLKSNI